MWLVTFFLACCLKATLSFTHKYTDRRFSKHQLHCQYNILPLLMEHSLQLFQQ
jgi:hypothetical protein